MNRSVVRAAFAMIALFALINLAKAQGKWQPVAFASGSAPITLATDRVLSFGETGSIEIGFSLSTNKADLLALPAEMVLFSQENNGNVRFRISIVKNGRGLLLYNGEKAVELPFDLSGGGYFQLGISSLGDVVRVVINDNEGNAPVQGDLGFGESRTFPIYLGGRADRSAGFVGLIHYLRIWESPVPREDFRTVFPFFGLPDASVSQRDNLLFYTEFTGGGVAAFYTSALFFEDIYIDDAIFVGARLGTPFVSLIPDGSVFAGLQIDAGPDGVHALRALALNDAGYLDRLPIMGSPAAIFDRAHDFSLDDGDRIKQIYGMLGVKTMPAKTGMNAGGSGLGRVLNPLLTVGFRTVSGKDSGTYGAKLPPGSPAGSGLFTNTYENDLKFPDVDAVYGYYDGTVITGFGFARRLRPQFDNIEGRWQPAALDPTPQKAEIAPPKGAPQRVTDRHGTYLPRETMRLRLIFRDLSMQLFSPGHFNLVLRLRPDGTYTDDDTTVRFDDEKTLWITSNSLKLKDIRYNKAKSYPVITGSSGSFGSFAGQFNSPNQPPVYKKSFPGYDLTKVNPMNFQADEGRKQNVIAEPDPLGYDYFPDQGKNVPHGLLLVSDAMDTSETQTSVSRTAREHVETHSSSLGFDIGIPKVASFGASSEVTNEIKTATTSQSQIVYHEEVQTNFALVADMSRLQLDPDFRTAILRLAAKVSKGQIVSQNDWETNIISVYGTHYPNAVTSGKVSRSLLRYSKQAASELRGKNEKLDTNASAIINKVKTKVTSAQGYGFSNSVEKEMTTQMEQMTNVGLADQLVPVFMDLRPLSELLSPVLWDDPVVFNTLNNGLSAAINSYYAKNAPDYSGPQYIWEPYGFAASLKSIDFTVKSTSSFNPTGNVIEEGFAGKFGFDFHTTGLTPEIVKTIDAAASVALSRNGTPVQKNTHYDLPADENVKYFTASELCTGGAAVAMLPSYEVDRVRTGLSTSGTFPLGTTTGTESVLVIQPLQTSKVATAFQKNDQITGIATPFVFSASARRLMDPAGDYKAFPNCAAKGKH